MKQTLILIGILFLTITTNSQAQNDNEFMDLVKNYTVDTLPFCIKYSDDIKSNIENNSFDINQDWVEHPGEGTEDNLLVRKFFFEGKNKVYVQNLWDRDTVDIEPIDDYLKSNLVYESNVVIKAQQYVGIVFGRDELSGSEMYFCTFTKKGTLISKIQLAFYMHSGSYTTEDGEKAPFYAEKTGCINKDFTITTDVDTGEPRKYKILASGKIIEIK